MSVRRYFIVLLFLLAGLPSEHQGKGQPPDGHLIEVRGLQPSYSSCSPLGFTIRNVSGQEFYAVVYVENFDAGVWKDDTFPYNLHEPMSLYEKLVFTPADKMKPGESWKISYDRCLEPRFVKEDKATFRRAIMQKDANSDSPILQRIRIDTYVGEAGQLKTRQRVWSESFKRVSTPSR